MKRHFEILDGLRGIAALSVVFLHLMEATYPGASINPFPHAYLAVDFFFMLSGFVIAYAYDKRWTTLSITEFFRIRVIRLHPLVVLGLVFGGIIYWLNPFCTVSAQDNNLLFSTALLLGSFLIPVPPLANRSDITHPLNGPSWSLFLEYLAYLFYAVFGHKLTQKKLGCCIAFSGLALLVTSIVMGNLHGGWGWSNIWMGPIRVSFPFLAGIFLYRSNFRLTIPYAYPILSILLLLVFEAPATAYNGIYEAVCVIVVFPVILVIGAGAPLQACWKKICRLSGELSYPIYILHAPLLYLFGSWVSAEAHTSLTIKFVAICVVAAIILLSWLALRFFDEPLRKWLNTQTWVSWGILKQKQYRYTT
jgi:peptidoglycan/LPS O-acetylase OafA/YrhL